MSWLSAVELLVVGGGTAEWVDPRHTCQRFFDVLAHVLGEPHGFLNESEVTRLLDSSRATQP